MAQRVQAQPGVSSRPGPGSERPGPPPPIARCVAASWAGRRRARAAGRPLPVAGRQAGVVPPLVVEAVRRREAGRRPAAARRRRAVDHWEVAPAPREPGAVVGVVPRSSQPPRREPPAAPARQRWRAPLRRAPGAPPRRQYQAAAKPRSAPVEGPGPAPGRCREAAPRLHRTAHPWRPASRAPLGRPPRAAARRQPEAAARPGWLSAASPCRPTTRDRRAIAEGRAALPCRPQSSPESSGLARKPRFEAAQLPGVGSGFCPSRNSW